MQNDKDLFHRIMGDNIIFFNKDANLQAGTYKTRPKALNHVENCPCNECERTKHATEVYTSLRMLRDMGSF